MSNDSQQPAPLNLTRWQAVPGLLMVVGGVLSCIGLFANPTEFGFSWLFAFIFFYTIALGALFMVLMHHLTDAGWSVGIRRFCEHLASLLGLPLIILFLPVGLLAHKIYSWMSVAPTDHLIAAKWPIFTVPGFWITSAVFFAIWWFLTSRLCRLSLEQDKTGSVQLTYKLRFHSGWGMVLFALALTFSAALWVKGLQYQWYSAIYGVYFFGSSVWAGLATIYVITVVLQRQGYLAGLVQKHYYYYLGMLLLGFTVFQAYAEFAQYFVVWNANMPVETFWYLIREHGNWWGASMILIFGHFLLPFFVLLPFGVKTNFKVVVPVCLWIWAMHALDVAFNIFPALHTEGYPLKWIWLPLGVLAFQGGLLSRIFLKKFLANPPYPKKDPRLLEAMGVNAHVIDDLAGDAGGVR